MGSLLAGQGQQAKLVDVNSPQREIDTEPGQLGEVWMKGPNVFKVISTTPMRLETPYAVRLLCTEDFSVSQLCHEWESAFA